MISVELRPTSALTPAELDLIARLRAGIDYGLPALGYQWAPKTWRALARADGMLAGHVGIVERPITIGNHPVRVGGISGVWTLPRYRGLGGGRAAMEAAARFIRDALLADFGLLLCGPAVQPFYAKLGWRPAPGPLVFEQPSGLEWPAGPIDLRGLPW